MTRASSVKEIVDEWWKYAKPSYNYCFKAEKEKLEELIHAHLATLSSDEARMRAAEARAERLAGACQGLLEQVRHDNESEATHHAVADGFDASEFGAYMPSAWHKGHAALDDAESCVSAQGNDNEGD